ncbi:uncharacterized protein M421DRAFT_313167 [Didymella exigua CBS 183.55]|uniref:Uncharacterized protein n=1 Tax=Didymella exigua CBS 183.55 TaxID=1150837 RepID=A0A6A5RUG6_9PLEO|nr:uncharacterized protein M421DRAFT_313167 [Didymella exigua CBS 183.55]KAF1931492.1 hypothetical protein M421DRAFT_313167 [Didymella exigua CBS 183.55]
MSNALAKFEMTLMQVSIERPTYASCGNPVSLLSSPYYWLVLLMRRLALVVEGSSRGGSSLQTEVLLSWIAITASCQLHVVPNLISLSSLLVVLCSSSESRPCVCLPASSCRYPTISTAATAHSSALHDRKLGEQTAFVCCQTAVNCMFGAN